MLVNGESYQSIWYDRDNGKVTVIDQRKLPFNFNTIQLHTIEDVFWSIKEMVVRGAPLIGVTAAYGLYLAIKCNRNVITPDFLTKSANYLKSARPTAVNLEKIIDEIILKLINNISHKNIESIAFNLAQQIELKEIDNCSKIGDFGLSIIDNLYKQNSKRTINILTHCNAGWLASVDWGMALSPIYKAFEKGIKVHVWVDETRPRNQGARLTAWELQKAGVPHTVIPDNTGGHLMQQGMVDMVIVGSDRTTKNGDVANKIGTYLKALAAYDNSIPFYVALPLSSIDFNMVDGVKNIPIEKRDDDEIRIMECMIDNEIKDALIMPKNTNVANYGFDVTPARLISALITEKGVCKANENSISKLFS